MKKIIIGLAILTSLTSATAFGNVGQNNPPNAKVLKAFESAFKTATDVVWEENAEFIKVRFGMNDFRVEAYYNADGELIGTARTILFNQLPLLAMNSLGKRFAQSSFYDVTEYTSNGDLYYGLTVETKSRKLSVRVLVSGDITIEKKTRL